MKRRPLESPVEPPARLRAFDPADWPGGDALDAWRAARQGYVQAFGYPADPVEWLRETVRQVRRASGLFP